MKLFRSFNSYQSISIVLLTVQSWLFLAACTNPFVSPTPTSTAIPMPTPTPIPAPASTRIPPEVKIVRPEPETEVNLDTDSMIFVSGTHNLTPNDHVWIFLKDAYGNYYLQSPDVDLLSDGTWEATNIRPLNGIRYIVAVYVSTQGHERIQEWVRVKRWGDILEDEITLLEGYLELDRVSIVTPGLNR